VTVVLVKGDDPSLVGQAVHKAVSELVGAGDRSLMVEEVDETRHRAGDGDPELTALVNAAHTPPFLTERRVVVGRHLALFGRKESVAPLVSYLQDPLPTTDLVLVWEKAPQQQGNRPAVPKSLQDAVTALGGTIVDAAPAGRGRRALLEDKLDTGPVRLDRAARQVVIETLGDEVARAEPLLAALAATFGEGARLTATDVAPYVGAAADVPPWELTDAIDAGDIGAAIERLQRMLEGGGRHPLEILAVLHRHVGQAFALDGARVASEKDAAVVLGLTGSTFPARKALDRSRRLGGERLAEAVRLVARADLDVRGASGMDPTAVVEVLVARLARLSR
jgi:DNA polymerase III subunit delta